MNHFCYTTTLVVSSSWSFLDCICSLRRELHLEINLFHFRYLIKSVCCSTFNKKGGDWPCDAVQSSNRMWLIKFTFDSWVQVACHELCKTAASIDLEKTEKKTAASFCLCTIYVHVLHMPMYRISSQIPKIYQ